MITPTPLTWPEINRLLDIINYAPCQSKEGDEALMAKTGLFQYYDEDRETLERVEGAEAAFLDYVPNARVRDEWRTTKYLPTEREAIINPTLIHEQESDSV